jgi:uncharacterized protein (TIGR02271 family)
MKRHGAIEVDKRAAQWREEGWTGFEREPQRLDAQTEMTARPFSAAASGEVTAEHERAPMPGATRDRFTVPSPEELAIPVVEEELQVGKREVERGGVRVQKRVSETPVEEEVTLRDEHVNVARRDTDYTFHGHESEAFKESLIEIKEAYEELIVNKKAKVVEEVVINKDVEEHTETVRETLRRTDVEVERLEPGRARSASASGPDAGDRDDSGHGGTGGM